MTKGCTALTAEESSRLHLSGVLHNRPKILLGSLLIAVQPRRQRMYSVEHGVGVWSHSRSMMKDALPSLQQLTVCL